MPRLTVEEKAHLERVRSEAKARLKEIAPTRMKLRELIRSYNLIYCRYYVKFTDADRKLAEHERYVKLKPSHRGEPRSGRKARRSLEEYSAEELLQVMSRDQISRIYATLIKDKEVMRG